MKLSKQFDNQFSEVVKIIHQARYNAIKSVNAELVKLYWNIGEYISKKNAGAEWGDSVVNQLADYIQNTHPEFKGFTRRGLYRMRQFYETYHDDEFVSAVLTQISWTNHLLILSKTKSRQEREFYLTLVIKEKYSSRELERQIDSGFYERAMIAREKVSPLVTQTHKDITTVFKDTYVLDFLNLPEIHSEKDLQKNIVLNLKEFILEFGKDFAFIGQEYRIQVGNNDYFIDLLFFHRGIKCLVMVELKITDFKPEYLGKMSFYLEALDRDIKKDDENPSVGIILCKSKDDEVVEYALSRHLSPTLVAEYKTKLIPKNILRKKLHELFLLQDKKDDGD
ncbi:MAG: PDDEXK nuclease domain-containing protein [Desulfobacterales bacterium]|jgi:predicted nuclease of restriction endonuclease-like (RecB) superfamily|nr:PDDEXK nuclease domain-containing protein [Desulfobacterales bacterium]